MTKEWHQTCKDCEKIFGYSDYSLQQDLKKGLSRPERCAKCRSQHSSEIKSIASSHFGLTPRKENRSILGSPYLGCIDHGNRTPVDSEEKPDPSGMDLGLDDSEHEHISKIYKALEDHQVLVIVAPTGTGKSTFIPYRLIEPLEGYEKDKFTKNGPIVVTQPRILAASGIPKAIGKKLLGSHVGAGYEIGYRHGDRSGKKKGEAWDRRNRLLFVTDGTLLNWIADGKIGDFSIIIIDEAHERSSTIDLILGLAKRELLKYPHLKLIIASATIDADSFINYFNEVTKVKLLDFSECQKSHGYEELPWGLKDISEADMQAQDSEKSDSEAEKRLKDYQKNMPEKVANKILEIIEATKEGGILGFLHGQAEVEEAVRLIKAKIGDKNNIRIFPVYTKLGSDRNDEATRRFDESDVMVIGNKKIMPRRVLIATNIAETSLTIPDIVYVVDSGLIKQSEWNSTTCRQELKTKFHSKDGCRQRWGRAGRVQKGFVYKLYSKEDFIRYFSDHTPPEITRECLDDVILTAKASGVQDISPSRFSWIEKPPEDELNRSLNVFNERQLVDQDNDMTEEGREVYRLSKRISQYLDLYDPNSANRALDVATMLVLADKYACLIEAVTALVMMPRMGNSLYWGEGLFLWNKEWDIHSKDYISRLHNELRTGCIDDLDLACKLFAIYEGKISGIPNAILSSWCKRYFINEENFEIIAAAREDILSIFSKGKKTKLLRPIDFSLVKRLRLLTAIAWPDRRVSIKDNPLRFIYSKTNIEGILSENATGYWIKDQRGIVAMMDKSDIVIDQNKKGVPVANFIVYFPDDVPAKKSIDIITNIKKIRKEYNSQETFESLFAHLLAPIGTNITVNKASKYVKAHNVVLPEIFRPSFSKLVVTEETDFDSSVLYDHEMDPKSLRNDQKGNNINSTPSTNRELDINLNFKVQWSNKLTSDQAFIENWKIIDGSIVATINKFNSAFNYKEFLDNIKVGNKLSLILKRPVFDMLPRKIIGFIAETEEGIAFPIPASDLSIEQNNPGLFRLENQKLEFEYFGIDQLTKYPRFSLLPKLETELEDVIKEREVAAYIEKMTVEYIYFSILGNDNLIHSARQPLNQASKFASDLSIGEKVILNVRSLVGNKGEITFDIKSTISPEDVEIFEGIGVKVEDTRLFCSEPISYKNLLKCQDQMPQLSLNLRGLYALSHQTQVYILEVSKVFETLQKEAISIKKQARMSDDETRSRVKQMQDKIKPLNVQLSEKSRQAIRDIINDAWNLSFLTEKLNRLAEAKSYLERQELNLANNVERLENARTVEFEEKVSGWIDSTKSNIFRVRSEIDELEREIYELSKIN